MPSSSTIVPAESDSVTTLAPNSFSFSTVYWATLPEPDTVATLPAQLSPRRASISWAKYTAPYPVASGRISEPPYSRPLPVSTPLKRFTIFLYWPNR